MKGMLTVIRDDIAALINHREPTDDFLLVDELDRVRSMAGTVLPQQR